MSLDEEVDVHFFSEERKRHHVNLVNMKQQLLTHKEEILRKKPAYLDSSW